MILIIERRFMQLSAERMWFSDGRAHALIFFGAPPFALACGGGRVLRTVFRGW